MPREPQNLLAAREYARLGWKVFPLRPNMKVPLTSNGFHAATTDRQQIDEWWLMTPTAGVGIATGSASKLIVVDVDPRNGGHESLQFLETKFGALPETVESRTGGGGRHLLFALDTEGIYPSAKPWSGIDIKADGGYICRVAGSRVLTRDLRWVPIESLTVGQPLWAFTEEEGKPGVHGRGWEPAFVTGIFPKMSPTVRVILASGRELIATPDHRFLAQTYVPQDLKQPRLMKWRLVKDLKKGAWRLPRFFQPWEEDGSRESGWFAGLLDGEGWVGTRDGRLSFCQKPGAVLERAKSFLRTQSIEFRENLDAVSGVSTISILGSTNDIGRFLGRIRPTRLISNWAPSCSLYVRSRYGQAEYDPVVWVEPAGRKEVLVLSTSTGTFFDEGYGSHNCAPFTVHPSGLVYHWHEAHDPSTTLAPAPAWVISALQDRKDKATVAASPAPSDAEKVIPEGHRDNALASLAGTMQRRGMTYESILRAMLAENDARCRPPLPEADVMRIVQSVARYTPDPDADPGVSKAAVEGRSIQFLDVIGLSKPEPIPWLLDGQIAFGDCSLIVGPPASGKSWLTYEIAVAGSMGLPILGRYPHDGGLRVLLVDEENPRDEVMRRLWLLTQAWKVSPKALSEQLMVTRPCQGWSFRDRSSVYALHQQVLAFKPDVVIFDSFVAVSTVVDEGDSVQVRRFFHDMIYPLRDICNSTMIFVHHTNKGAYLYERLSSVAGLVRGSIDFVAAVDSAVLIEARQKKGAESQVYRMESIKVRRGSAPEPRHFELIQGVDGGLRPMLREVDSEDPQARAAEVKSFILMLLQDRKPVRVPVIRKWVQAAVPQATDQFIRNIVGRMIAQGLIVSEMPNGNKQLTTYRISGAPAVEGSVSHGTKTDDDGWDDGSE